MKPYRVIITPPLVQGTTVPDTLRANGCDVIIHQGEYPILDPQELGEFLSTADGAIVGMEIITDEVLSKCPSLRVLARTGTGLDNVDLRAATRHNVLITNTPGANSRSVAELTMSFLTMLARRGVTQHQIFQTGAWDRDTGQELYGKTLAIIGLGHIGKLVAILAQAYGMTVVANDIAPDEAFAHAHNIPFVRFEEALAQGDFVSLHVPLTDLTRIMVNTAALDKMKPGSFLVNTSRGPVVDVPVIVSALHSGQLSGFATDVPVVETVLDAELRGLDNVITTPHIGGYTVDALQRVFQLAAENILTVLSGERPAHVVNPEVYSADE
jgi:phosphoglycerate dehydrogenase-like enzyme